MPARKRKVPENQNDEYVEENPAVEDPKKNNKADRKRKAVKKKSNDAETVTPTQKTEKHVVFTILLNAQTNEAFHNKYIKELTNQYEKMGHNEFLAMFICCLKQLLEKEEAVAQYANVGLQFMAKFATSLTNGSSDDMHEFLEAVFDWVLKTVSLSHNVRSRLCRFVNFLLDSLGSNASLDDTLFDNILKYMFDRLKDLHPSVRVQAIKALQRLQMPDDPDDPIVKIYTFHLASDPSGPVRQAVLTCLGRNIHTIPVILERLWDIDEKVRRHVYVHMANYPVKTYKVIHRLTFLEQGLNDRADAVRKIVTGIMIPQWLESYNKNYLAFLSGLKLDASDAEIERFRSTARLALPEIFKTQKPEELIATLCLDDDENSVYPKCIPFDKLTIESSLFWCLLIAFFQDDERRSDLLESVIPELSIFCCYVEKYNDTIIGEDKEPWEVIISQSILFNLIEILLSFDYGDEIGRQRLRTLAVHLLTTNPCNERIIKSLIKILEKLVPSSDDRLQVIHDVIRSLVDQDLLEKSLNAMDPNVEAAMKKDDNLNVKVSSLKLKLFELKENESKFVKMKDYASVSRIAEEVAVCQDQLVALIRPFIPGGSNSLQQKRITKELQIKALKLAFHGVCSEKVDKLNPAMCQLYTDFIRLKIESIDMDVRNWALKCGATFSLLYEQLAKDVFAALNKQFFDHHHTEVWTTSVSAMFQLIDRYGFSYFDEDPNGETGEKEKGKPKKSRLLYNTTAYEEDPEDESNVERGNVTIKGLIYLFGHFMDTCDDIHLMSALIDGFGLLILHGVYVDEKLVSRLILLYFNPSTEAEINQILSIFFETLIHHKKQECLEAALIQTLTKIIEASNESPLHEIKIETVLRFIISSTLPVYCKGGTKIHDNIALSLLKWMKNNATNREVLKITSKEILSLEISDDNAVRQMSQEYVNELLEMPMDSKTERNLKSFNEKMKGNCPADIQFSSVAPANGIDGENEIYEMENDELTQSDNDSSNRNDDDENSDIGVTNGSREKSMPVETPDDVRSESNDSSRVELLPEKIGNVEQTTKGRKYLSRKDSTNQKAGGSDGKKRSQAKSSIANIETTPRRESSFSVAASPTVEPCETSNEDSQDATQPQQLLLQVDVHTVPVNTGEVVQPSPSKMRKRVRDLMTEQQQLNSPDIQPAPIGTRQQRKKKQKIVPPPKPTSVSEPKRNLKRKSDTLKSSKYDDDDTQPAKKKSKAQIGKKETPEKPAEKANVRQYEQQQPTPAYRMTRRSRTMTYENKSTDEKSSKANARNIKESSTTKTIQKKTALPVRTKSQADNTKNQRKDQTINQLAGTKKTNVQKKSVQSEGTRTSTRKDRNSESRPPSRSSRRTRTMSFNEDATPIKISSTTPKRSVTTSKTKTATPKTAAVNEKSTRQRQIASEPQKSKPKTGQKNSTPSTQTEEKKTAKKRSSLSNLDDIKDSVGTSQHRTRRALAKEFMVNNIITRNRSSIDEVDLLRKLPIMRRKSIGSSLVEKQSSTMAKSTKNTGRTSSIPSRLPIPSRLIRN